MNKYNEYSLPDITVWVDGETNLVKLAKSKRTGVFVRLCYAQQYYNLYTRNNETMLKHNHVEVKRNNIQSVILRNVVAFIVVLFVALALMSFTQANVYMLQEIQDCLYQLDLSSLKNVMYVAVGLFTVVLLSSFKNKEC